MSRATKVTGPQDNGIYNAEHFLSLREKCRDSLAGASKADRLYLTEKIALVDQVISNGSEVTAAFDNAWHLYRKLASALGSLLDLERRSTASDRSP
jgi:pyrimidine operon attenuation protein/uracil phosphoribosyltransferase